MAKYHNISVLTSIFKNLPFYEKIKNIDIFRIQVFFRRKQFKASFLSLLSFSLFGCYFGYKFLRKNKIDIINAHFVFPSGIVGLFLSKIFKIPLILTIHGGDIYDPTRFFSPHKNFILKFVIKFIIKYSDKIIVYSSDMKNKLEQYYQIRKNIEVISLGLNPIVYKLKTRKELNFKDDEFIIISIGRLIKRKGYEYLLKAIKELQNIKLILIGDGPLKENLKVLTKKLKIDKQVFFAGYVSDEEKYQYLSISNVFVSSSLHEGFGIVFLEAIFTGLPIIATSSGGQTDFLVDKKNAILVPPYDILALKEAIITIKNDKNLSEKFSKENKQLSKNFTITSTANKHLEIFRSLNAYRNRC